MRKPKRWAAVLVTVATLLVVAAAVVPPSHGGGGTDSVIIRVVDPDRDSLGPPALPGGLGQAPDGPSDEIRIRANDPILNAPDGDSSE